MSRTLPLAIVLASAASVLAEDDPAVRELARSIPPLRAQALTTLAWDTVRAIASGRPVPAVPDETTAVACGAFVTLVGPRGMRGCYGDLDGSARSIEHAVRDAARGAAAGDTRFRPIKPSELHDLRLIVSLTLPIEPVASAAAVDPDRYGILVTAGSRRAVLLPGEAKTAAWGLSECLRKAGIAPAEPVTSFRFRTLTFESRGVR